MDNNITNKKNNTIRTPMYKCEICKRVYPTIEERNACEAKCIAAKKKAEAELAKQKLDKEKTTRKEEIEKKYKELTNLIKSYCKDYGSLYLNGNHFFDDDTTTLSKFLGWWL